MDSSGTGYGAGDTNSTDFPTVNALQPTLGSDPGDAFVAKVFEASTGITLTASGYKVKGLQKTDPAWNGATSTNVDVNRNGQLIATIDTGE